MERPATKPAISLISTSSLPTTRARTDSTGKTLRDVSDMAASSSEIEIILYNAVRKGGPGGPGPRHKVTF